MKQCSPLLTWNMICQTILQCREKGYFAAVILIWYYIFAGKPDSTFPNIWEWLISLDISPKISPERAIERQRETGGEPKRARESHKESQLEPEWARYNQKEPQWARVSQGELTNRDNGRKKGSKAQQRLAHCDNLKEMAHRPWQWEVIESRPFLTYLNCVLLQKN